MKNTLCVYNIPRIQTLNIPIMKQFEELRVNQSLYLQDVGVDYYGYLRNSQIFYTLYTLHHIQYLIRR